MSDVRTHHVKDSDGVSIGATVHGHGPPLVFLQGIIADGDLDFGALADHLGDRFTCHLTSMRGRGVSSHHPDLGLGRVIDDFVGYLEALDEPAGLVGWSGGASWSLGVAARTDKVRAVVPFEPVANSVMDEQEQAALGGALTRAGELAAEGDMVSASRAFAEFPFTDEELTEADGLGYFRDAARYVPDVLAFFEQMAEFQGPWPDSPEVLGQVRAPVLVMIGSETKPVFATSARYVASHLPDGRVQEIAGVAHAAPLTHPEVLAEALADFFTPVLKSA